MYKLRDVALPGLLRTLVCDFGLSWKNNLLLRGMDTPVRKAILSKVFASLVNGGSLYNERTSSWVRRVVRQDTWKSCILLCGFQGDIMLLLAKPVEVI